MNLDEQRKELVELANTKMPFGKFKGHFLIQLPEPYLVWMKGQGWPPGKIGKQLQQILEIKVNGLEGLIYPLINK